MAVSYQISCPPGSIATIADPVTQRGGTSVTVLNAHTTEPLYIGGDENELQVGGGTSLSTSSGLRLAAGKAISLVLEGNEAIYGRSGTSTVTVTANVFRSDARTPHAVA